MVATCSGGQITKCPIGQKIVGITCSACQTPNFVCNGITESTCSSVASAEQCVSGVVANCTVGKKLSSSQIECQTCGSGRFCDGETEISCNLIANAQTCSNGLLTQCSQGLKVNNEKTACESCSLNMFCNGSTEAACSSVANAV